MSRSFRVYKLQNKLNEKEYGMHKFSNVLEERKVTRPWPEIIEGSFSCMLSIAHHYDETQKVFVPKLKNDGQREEV